MPASEEKSISQFTTASSISPNSLVFVSTPNASAPSGYDSEKATASELGEAIVNDFEYTQDLNTENKRVTGAINELHSSIGADAYDDTATYAVGDLCIHNNTLYKCTTAITTAEAWNASHWTATSIADELALRQPKTDNILATTDKTVVGAINELNTGMIGHYSTGVIKFNSLNWSQSASGMYYASIDLDSLIPSGKSIIGITIEGWNNLRSTDVVIPYIRTSRTIGVMSNVNSFADVNTGYGYSILYV